jgi:hypothetical protein
LKRYLRTLYAYWLSFGHAIGRVVTPLQLLLVYVVVFGGSRLATLIARKDILDRRFRARPSFWTTKQSDPPSLESARHQF